MDFGRIDVGALRLSKELEDRFAKPKQSRNLWQKVPDERFEGLQIRLATSERLDIGLAVCLRFAKFVKKS